MMFIVIQAPKVKYAGMYKANIQVVEADTAAKAKRIAATAWPTANGISPFHVAPVVYPLELRNIYQA